MKGQEQAHCAVELDGELVWLLAHKAGYWPARRILIIADIHFGKAAAFRALGVPVPRGTTTQNLLALDALLASYACEEIVFLGDFLHARAAHAPATLAAMLAWRTRHPDVRLTVVRGNHDAHAGDPAAALGIRMVDEPHQVGKLSFCHHPDTVASGYVLAGHVHPVFHLRADRGGLRLPCFLLGRERAILPSFGAFTGGHAVRPGAGERVYVTADAAIFPLPANC
ncbi:ligase-associated DNA damage response endonuclease PdeM [Janthinobacterium sp. GW460P]|uniref:ligase-associated DNA damage response endonuclease PdeM n=1 Tax=unclassified Janthinobacterium TaxID=2610881 RepID=UPI000A323AAC|nr:MULTISPECIES: ligase-associated DNA damage response endonuclease PdeM [unclassified Janthinobacterium]MCC7701142.1 ligase-associated DNA damage response endonuclease PdeM [Janthinobacterium sp. GW460P]MCC7706649.1 ligase-associated DNA damage response endonuclease PdeM [Janthinobacterium sp. GW460W]